MARKQVALGDYRSGDLRSAAGSSAVSRAKPLGVFGDLSHPAFYIICLLNAAVVIWPPESHTEAVLVQFALRAAFFRFVIYFFVPYRCPCSPLQSIVAIIAVGMGFLLLAPVLLLVLRAAVDRPGAGPGVMADIFVVALSVLPASIVVGYLSHRSTLHGALRYSERGDPHEPMKPLDAEALKLMLEQVEANADLRAIVGAGAWRPTERSMPYIYAALQPHRPRPLGAERREGRAAERGGARTRSRARPTGGAQAHAIECAHGAGRCVEAEAVSMSSL